MTASYRKYSSPVIELIRRRTSVRSYSRELLATDVAGKVDSYLSNVQGPFDKQVQMKLLQREAENPAERLGAYGTISGAHSFITAVTGPESASLLQVGYMMEDVVLYLTSLDLGSCWMAGTFSQTRFRSAANVGPNEILPIVTAVGYPATIRNPVDFLMKPTGVSKRLPWEQLFFAEDLVTPLPRDFVGDYATPLEMVRLSPSASNKQPWRVIRQGSSYHFYLRHDEAYARRYPYDIQKVDMGIAMYHFQTAAAESGLGGSWIQQEPVIKGLPATCEYIFTWQSGNTVGG